MRVSFQIPLKASYSIPSAPAGIIRPLSVQNGRLIQSLFWTDTWSVSFPNDPIYFVLNFFPKYEIGAVATTSKVNAQLAEKAIANPETRADKFYILNPIIVEVRF